MIDKDREREYNAKYYREHRGSIVAIHRRRYEECPEEHREASRKYKREHAEKVNNRSKEYRHRVRLEVIQHYGGVCACCGEAQEEFLCMDHINGGGNKHRAEIGPVYIYFWLRQNGYPKGFRVLCHNCNMARAHRGYCPHEKGGQHDKV